MRRVTHIETSDGVLHKTEREARRHCEEQAGGLITKVAHEMAHQDKIMFIIGTIEKNLDVLAETHRWRLEATEPMDDDDES